MTNIYVDLINGETTSKPFATGKIFDTEPNIDKTKIPVDTETTDTNDNIDEKFHCYSKYIVKKIYCIFKKVARKNKKVTGK